MKKINIVVIPADNRPVSYTLPVHIENLNKKMLPLIEELTPKVGVNFDEVRLNFPRGKTFEIEID